jgi:hypothetical protein
MKFKSLAIFSVMLFLVCSFVVNAQDTSILAVDGSVFYDDGATLVPNGWNVDVINNTRGLSLSSTTGDAGQGRYGVTFLTFDPTGIVASSGDELEIVVTDSDGNEHSLTYNLTNGDINASSATVDVVIDVPVPPEPIQQLIISGTVYYQDSRTPAPTGLTVEILGETQETDAEGKYSITIEDEIVARSGDEIIITVAGEIEGETVEGSASLTLGQPGEDGSLTITEANVIINASAPQEETALLAIEGTVFLKNGTDLAPNGLTVDVTNKTQNLSLSSTTGDAGPSRYSVTFLTFDPTGVVAETSDEIEVTVTDAASNKRANVVYKLATIEILENKATINITLDVTSRLTVKGTVYAVDEVTPVPDSFTIRVANPSRDIEISETTSAEGKYSATLETMAPGEFVAASDEEIVITVFDPESNTIGNQSHILITPEVVENEVTINVTTTYIAVVSFTGILAPGLNMISVPLINSEATVNGNGSEPVLIETIGDLKTLLGEDTPIYHYNTSEHQYEEASVDIEITGDLGLVVMLTEETEITFTGKKWPGMINLVAGLNMFAVPLDSPQAQTVGDLKILMDDEGAPIYYYNISEGRFQEAEGDMAIEGGVGYVTMLLEAIDLSIDGEAWENAGAPPPPPAPSIFDLTSTPLMAVKGTVINENTGEMFNGLSVTVRHLNSGTVVNDTTGSNTNGQFSAVFLDVFNNQSFRVGDVFKIDIRSGDGDINFEPIQYKVTQDDIKLGRINLGDLTVRAIPKHSKLMQNWPNPFNPETWIPFQLSTAADVSINIYDIHGRIVRRFELGQTPAGVYNKKSNAIYWNGTNDAGERVSSGVYFYHIQAGEFSASRKMVILK